MADIHCASEGSWQERGRVAWEGGMAGHPANQGATRPSRNSRGKEEKAKPRKLASLRFTSPLTCFLARLIVAAWLLHHLLVFICISIFSCLRQSCDLSTLHPTEHSTQVFFRSLPLRSGPFQLNLVPKTLQISLTSRGDRSKDTGESFV